MVIAEALEEDNTVVNGMDYLLTWNCTYIANATLPNRIETVCRSKKALRFQLSVGLKNYWRNKNIREPQKIHLRHHTMLAAQLKTEIHLVTMRLFYHILVAKRPNYPEELIMASVKFKNRTSTGKLGNFNYEYECTCANGKKHTIKVTSGNDSQAKSLAKLECEEKCGES